MINNMHAQEEKKKGGRGRGRGEIIARCTYIQYIYTACVESRYIPRYIVRCNLSRRLVFSHTYCIPVSICIRDM